MLETTLFALFMFAPIATGFIMLLFFGEHRRKTVAAQTIVCATSSAAGLVCCNLTGGGALPSVGCFKLTLVFAVILMVAGWFLISFSLDTFSHKLGWTGKTIAAITTTAQSVVIILWW